MLYLLINNVVNFRSFQLFIRNYEAVMDGFMLDDQEGPKLIWELTILFWFNSLLLLDDASITSLTVQIFTVKSIAHKLLEEEDAFAIITRYYKEHMKKRIFDNDGIFYFQLWGAITMST